VRTLRSVCLALLLLVALGAALAAPGTPSAAEEPRSPPGYAIRACMPLTARASGVDGRLELLEDERLTPELDQELSNRCRPSSGCWSFRRGITALMACPRSQSRTAVKL